MMLIVSQPHRGDLTALSEAINNCRILPSVALARAETIMSDRQAALKGLQRNEAPDPGVELQQLVFGAYTASLRTDNDLIEWLKAVDAADPAGQPCYHRDDLLYKQFVTESSDATAAKKQFVAAFNPVARKFGFAPPSWQWWEF